jgi:hypothetical protein
MTSPIIERVKRAIWDVAIDKPSRLDLEDMARAAIKAMREPTEEMLSTGCVDLGSGGELDNENLSRIWREMIDAALIEKSES